MIRTWLRTRPAYLAALLGAALLAGCGGGGGAPAAATTTIRIKDFVFDPAPATIKAGQRITVANDDGAPHTLTDRPANGGARFDTGTIRRRQAGSFTVARPATYAVYCVIHPFMKGEVKVVR